VKMSSVRSTREWKNHQYFQQLRNGVWFGNLPHDVAYALFVAGSSVEYPAGQLVYLEDSPNQGLFGIIEGTVHFETVDDSGRRILLNVAGPGHWFGDVAGPPENRTMISAHAFQRVRVWKVPVYALRRLLREMPELCKAYEQLTAMRISTLLERICVMHRPGALVQVAGCLALLHRTLKENAPASHSTFIFMTQSDLADMTGLSRQTINGIIGQLEDEGLITVQHRKIEIQNSEALDDYYLSKSSNYSMLA
jgi:CRP/FNR family transcriptional regulator, cyclic AMP receptor protein